MPPNTSHDVETEPLSGNPHFHKIMLKSHVKTIHHLQLPAKIIAMLPSKTTPVILFRGSRRWEMNYLGGAATHRRFDNGWKAFVCDNMLNIGDVCLFEIMARDDTLMKFKVQVLRGDFPSVLLDKHEGSPNNPVVIDDD